MEYDSTYCDLIVSYFGRYPFTPVYTDTLGSDGKTHRTIAKDKRGNDLRQLIGVPSKKGFERIIGIDHQTLINWANKHKEFALSIIEAEKALKSVLKTHGIEIVKHPKTGEQSFVIAEKTYTPEERKARIAELMEKAKHA